MPAIRPAAFVLRLAMSAVVVMVGLHTPNAHQRTASVEAANINVTSLSDPGDGTCDETECTLREAILVTNSSAGEDWIKIAPNGTISLTSPLPIITESLFIDATDRTFRVDGGGMFRVLSATAPITLTNLIIQNGLAPEGEGGGGAYFGANTVLTDVTFRANAMTDAHRGGGAYFAGPTSMTGGGFIANVAGLAGGGAFFQSTAVISGVTFV